MQEIENALVTLLPAVGSVIRVENVGGGCISESRRVVIRGGSGDHESLFVKSNDESFLANFRCEWDGLQRLCAANVVKVPGPLAVGTAEGRAWLVTEWIEQGRKGPDFYRVFGQALAQLHRATLGTQIGLDRDNFLGAARQVNSRSDSWVEFVAVNRIGYQWRWAVDQGLVNSRLRQDVERIVDSMAELLQGRDESTSLLHGDLWSGNYLCDSQGKLVLIDPAVYHGCREAEFGMLRLFGACPAEFYDAYQHSIPMPAGWQRRVNVYVLYHLLNHLNLFGGGYLGQCQSVAAEILK